MGNGKKGPQIPMIVPGIGGQKQPFDITQAAMKICNGCGSEFFDKAFRMGIISRFAPGNTLNQDIPVEFAVHICRDCGLEFGKEKVVV